jgi:hypothetical protein
MINGRRHRQRLPILVTIDETNHRPANDPDNVVKSAMKAESLEYICPKRAKDLKVKAQLTKLNTSVRKFPMSYRDN